MRTQTVINTYILSKKVALKLAIFRYLLQQTNFIGIPLLADYFGLSEVNCHLYLKELNYDLQTRSSLEMSLVTSKGLIKLSTNQLDQARAYYRLQGFYCQEATNYKIIAALFSPEVRSIVALSQQTHFSISYVYSRLKTINQLLALYGLALRFTKQGQKQLIGDEIKVTYCILDLYWHIFSNTNLPFQNQSMRHMQFEEMINPTVYRSLANGALDKLRLLLVISMRYPYTSVKAVQNELAKYPELSLFLQPDMDIIQKSVPISDEQRLIINLLAQLSISKTDETVSVHQRFELLAAQKIDLFIYARALVDQFARDFELPIPVENRELHTLNIFRNRLYNKYLNRDQPNTPMPSTLFYRENPQFEGIQKQVTQFYLAFRGQTAHYQLIKQFYHQENIDWMVEELLHLYDRYQPIPQIKIGVNYTSDYYVSEDIVASLTNLYSDRRLGIQKSMMTDCAIIITDCALAATLKHKQIIYLLNDLTNDQEWQQLFAAVNRAIIKVRYQYSK